MRPIWKRVTGGGNRRWRLAPALALCLVLLTVGSSQAFWPFGSGGSDGGSGLDLDKGYDVNTVTTVKGKVLAINLQEGGGPLLIELRSSVGALFVVAGPRWFWKENGIPVLVGDELTGRGSLTEGKDGQNEDRRDHHQLGCQPEVELVHSGRYEVLLR